VSLRVEKWDTKQRAEYEAKYPAAKTKQWALIDGEYVLNFFDTRTKAEKRLAYWLNLKKRIRA